MKVIPRDKRSFESDVPSDDIVAKLKELVDAHEFKGDVWDSGFQLERVLGYKNSGKPIIDGTLENQGTRTIIHIDMHLERSARLFLYAGHTFVGAMVILGLVGISTREGVILVGSALLFFVFIVAFANLIFFIEADISRDKLEHALDMRECIYLTRPQ